MSRTYIATDFIENYGKIRYKSTSSLNLTRSTLSMYRVLTEILIILTKISKTVFKSKNDPIITDFHSDFLRTTPVPRKNSFLLKSLKIQNCLI